MSSISIQPDLVRLRRRAKDLLKAAQAADAASLAFLQTHAPGVGPPKLAVAQLAVARSEGFTSWSQLKKAAEDAATSQLFHAVNNGDRETAAAILAGYPSCATRRNDNGSTLLHTSVWADDPELVQLLIDAGVPKDALWGSSAHTPLSWATTVGCLKTARALLDAGAAEDLFTAAGLGDLDAVKSFWPNGKLVEHPSRTGSSRFDAEGNQLERPPARAQDQVSDALYFAARSGHAPVVRWLLDHGADSNFRGYEGGTALHWGEFSNNADVCRMLREAGGSDELLDFGYRATPRAFGMICPAGYGMTERLRRRLNDYPGDANIKGGYGTPLNAAAWNNQPECAAVLIERGADLFAKNAAGLTALEVAQNRGFEELAALLSATLEVVPK